MTDVPSPGGSGDTNQNSTGGNHVEPSGSEQDERSLAWRYNLDFGFNPNWLSPSGTTGRQLPATLAMFNDWVRTNISTGDSTTTATTFAARTAALPVSDASPYVVNMTGSRPLPPSNTNMGQADTFADNTHILLGQGGGGGGGGPARAVRSFPSIPIVRPIPNPDNEAEVDFPPTTPAPAPSRRDSRPYVVDVESNPEWSPASAPTPTRDEDGDANLERSPAEIIRQSPEARAFLAVLERYAPFLLILFLKGLFDHGSGLVCFFALLITFSHANTLLKKEVAKQTKRGVFFLLMISANLLICIAFMFYVFDDQRLYQALIFFPTGLDPSTVYSLLWLVCVTDYIAKFFTIIVKSCIVALPEHSLPFQKRGKYYLFIESSSQLYRSLLPVYPWLLYLFESYEGTYKILSILLCSFYIMCKAVDLVQRGKAWRIAFAKFLQPVHYGTSPSETELEEAGVCPICHDSFNHATRLSCSHIFCEECVSTWFDRERTCPMCRTRVVDDPMYRDGSTTHFIQIF